MASAVPPQAASARRERPLLGIVFKLAATLSFGLMFVCVKWVGGDYPTGQIVFYRSAFALIPVLVMVHVSGQYALLITQRPLGHLIRSLCGVVSISSSFIALTLLPLADVTVIMFVMPLFVVVLAALILRETIHIYRWGAVLFGFLGVLIVASAHSQIGGSGGLVGVGFALASAFFAAFAMIVIRHMSMHEHAITIAFYFSLSMSLFSLLSIFWGWNVQDLEGTVMLILLGVLGGLGQIFMNYGYRYAEASMLAPFDYTAMIWSVTFGLIFFNEFPVLQVWLGAVVIVVAGLAVFLRERYLEKRRREGSAGTTR